MKIITDSNLVPCKRGRVLGLPIMGALADISQDPHLAQAVVAKVACIFDLSRTEVKISGYARKENHAFLYIQIWFENAPIRTVAFRDVGYAGLLHVDLVRPKGADGHLYEADFFGDLKCGMEYYSMDDAEIRERIWFVQNRRLQCEFYLPSRHGAGSAIPSFRYSVGGNIPVD